MITFGSLFSGIGGFDLGLERAGMLCAWQVEIDDYATRVLEKHWPNVKRFRDVRDTGAYNLTPVDLICGGFPCQPHSIAGKRKGAEDDRDLWPEYRRIITELRPRWVVAENVPGIRGTILDAVLSDLDDLDYTTGTIVVPACAFDAPHRRERVFILAHTFRGSVQPDRRSCTLDGASSADEGETRQRQRSGDAARCSGETMAHASQPGLSASEQKDVCGAWWWEEGGAVAERSWWSIEPGMGRVAHGVPARVDRLRTLGNAVVPQVIEWIGRRIIEADDQAQDYTV